MGSLTVVVVLCACGVTSDDAPSCEPVEAVECDLFAQDCPEGERCVPYSIDDPDTWDAEGCFVVASDPIEIGEACAAACGPIAGVDDCGVGAMCWDVDDSGIGRCVELCARNGAELLCVTPDTFCTILNTGTLPVCLPLCDPVAQDCGQGELCATTQSDAGFTCLPQAAEPKRYGEACDRSNDCGAGMFCIVPAAVPGCGASVGCCSEFCDVDDPAASSRCPDADAGQQCLSYYLGAQPAVGYEHVGVCALPP